MLEHPGSGWTQIHLLGGAEGVDGEESTGPVYAAHVSFSISSCMLHLLLVSGLFGSPDLDTGVLLVQAFASCPILTPWAPA